MVWCLPRSPEMWLGQPQVQHLGQNRASAACGGWASGIKNIGMTYENFSYIVHCVLAEYWDEVENAAAAEMTPRGTEQWHSKAFSLAL